MTTTITSPGGGSPQGQDLIDIALPHVGERYKFGANVPKDNANWHGPWDCAELVSWAVFQTSAILYGCDSDDGNPSTADAFTGYWVRDAQRFGKKISVDQASQTAGAAVLRLAVPHGLGGHIVLSDGVGGTVEAHSEADGVIRGKLAARRWDFGILVPGIAYTTTGVGPSISQPNVIARQTDDQADVASVRRIQQALRTAGFDPGPIDGSFGPHTTAAVIAFQVANGLTPDGEVGKVTAAALKIRLQAASKP